MVPARGIVIRSSSPTPNENNSLVLASSGSNNQGTIYPFNKPLSFRKESEKKAFAFFSNWQVVSPEFLDLDALNELGIFKEVEELLEYAGFGFLLRKDPGTYDMLVREFMSTIEVIWEFGDIDRTFEGGRCKWVKEWKFRLGGRYFTLSAAELRIVFGIYDTHTHEVMPNLQGRDKFWEEILGSQEGFVSPSPATMIKCGIWKIIHRLLAIHLHTRLDGGRSVSTDDLDILKLIYTYKRVNLVGVISAQFKRYSEPTYKGKALGGGPFITMVARHLGFILDEAQCMNKVVINTCTMVNMKMLKADRVTWIHRKEPPLRNLNRLRARGNTRATPPTPPPSPPHIDPQTHSTTNPDSFDFVGLRDSIDSLSHRHDELTTFTHNFADYTYAYHDWQGEMLQHMYNHMGIGGYRDPPQTSRWNPNPPPQSTNPQRANDDDEDDDNEDSEENIWESGSTPTGGGDDEMELDDEDTEDSEEVEDEELTRRENERTKRLHDPKRAKH